MRIAICDDSAEDARAIEFALMGISHDLDLSIERYESGAEFLRAAQLEPPFDCVFLDVYLGSEDGMQVADELLRLSPSTQIVFCTTSTDHAVEAFRVHAIDYIVKPYDEQDIVQAYARVGMNATQDRRVMLRSEGDVLAVSPHEVVTVKSDRHYVVLGMTSGRTLRVHANFSDVLSSLGSRFVQIKRGIAVNMEYVDRMGANVVTLVDGTSHIMSRRRKDEVIQTFTRFLVKE